MPDDILKQRREELAGHRRILEDLRTRDFGRGLTRRVVIAHRYDCTVEFRGIIAADALDCYEGQGEGDFDQWLNLFREATKLMGETWDLYIRDQVILD